jgi:hypothetical protein
VKKRRNIESLAQQELTQWLAARHILSCHVPNERAAKVQHLVKLKAEGMKKGVPDNLIFDEPAEWNMRAVADNWGVAPENRIVGRIPRGVAIELKAPGEKPSNEQLAWLELLRRKKWVAAYFYSAESAISWLVELGFR